MENINTPRNSFKIDSELLENINEYEEFFLLKENNVFKLIVEKTNNNNIIIRCKRYITQININEFSIIIKNSFNNIDEVYKYIINIFENNKVNIKEIKNNKEMKLLLTFFNGKIEKKFEIILIYNKDSKNLIFNELKNNKNEINNIKNDMKLLEKEINNLKNNSKCKSINFLNDIENDSYAYSSLDNTFTVFKSIDNILYLIYSNKNKSIISYNLIKNNKEKQIKNAHDNYITNFRHYSDNYKRDLIMSISNKDNNIKLWDNNSWNCLLNIKKINVNGVLNSACFLNNNNQLYILTSNCNMNGNSESFKVYNFNGNKIKEIEDSCCDTFFIDTYYDNKSSKNYIITGNYGFIKSYDYNENILYHKYCDNDDDYGHLSIVINNNNKVIKLIESSCDGLIRIWDFKSGELLNKINICNKLFGICLLEKDYLLVGCKDKKIKVIDTKNGILINSITGHNNFVIGIKTIYHPQYGECLISQGFDNSIKLWNNIN